MFLRNSRDALAVDGEVGRRRQNGWRVWLEQVEEGGFIQFENR